ncbi:BC10 family protein [Faecalimonas umbilicata]|nr:BC10 family protein [Faecalimonas umbilicata]
MYQYLFHLPITFKNRSVIVAHSARLAFPCGFILPLSPCIIPAFTAQATASLAKSLTEAESSNRSISL